MTDTPFARAKKVLAAGVARYMFADCKGTPGRHPFDNEVADDLLADLAAASLTIVPVEAGTKVAAVVGKLRAAADAEAEHDFNTFEDAELREIADLLEQQAAALHTAERERDEAIKSEANIHSKLSLAASQRDEARKQLATARADNAALCKLAYPETIAELQAAQGRLNGMISAKILGDPRQSVSLAPAASGRSGETRRPLRRDCADESVRQGVAPGDAICPHDGQPCAPTPPAASAGEEEKEDR